jgi:hypothetical protein
MQTLRRFIATWELKPKNLYRLVCLLVFLSLLNNPFLAALGPSRGIVVEHPPSFRATSASAELLKFSSPKVIALVVDFTFAFPSQNRIPLASLYSCAMESTDSFFHLSSEAISANLWFRPPPSV